MEPEKQKLEEIGNFNDIFEMDDTSQNINILNTNMMKNIAHDFRKSHRNSIQLRKTSSMDFQEKLNLDIMIDKLLQALQRVKIGLLELDDLSIIKDNANTVQFKKTFAQDINKYNKTMLLRQSQLGSLVYLIDHRKQQNFIKHYLELYGKLNQFIIQPSKADFYINIGILEEATNVQIDFLEEYKDMMDLLKLNLVHSKYLTDFQSLVRNTNRLKVINSKIATIAQVFPYACTVGQDDLFSFKKTDQRWRNLLGSSITHKFYADQKKVHDSFLVMKSGLNLVNATMSILHQTKDHWNKKNWGKIFGNATKIMKCAIFKENATHQAELLISDPNSQLAKQIWNLPDEPMFRSLIIGILPSIAYSEQIYIERSFKQFLDSKGESLLPEVTIKTPEAYAKNLFQKVEYQKRIPMRINCPYPLKYRFKDPAKDQPGYLDSLRSYFKKKSQAPLTLIYHIHGGGFISMTSFIHQLYTRLWSNNLEAPIVSVDYGKAPEHPFPEGLHDCFEGYMWTLYIFRQIFQLQPVKVVLVGDSAGGNLVAALTNMLITYNLRVPDGIVLVYPALSLDFRCYTPSFLTALNDMILPHTFLKVCLKAYVQDESINPKTDCFLSPIFASDEVLSKYPPTRIFVGSRDPFHDDCCRFTERLNKLQPGISKLMIFEQFPHGFLQFDVKTQPHEYSRQATKEVECALRQLLMP